MIKTRAVLLFILALCVPAWSQTTPPQLFDKFGDVCCDDEKARLDSFAVSLANDPEATGYIVFYGGPKVSTSCSSSRKILPRRGESAARAARLKPYLSQSRGINADMLVVIDGGYREAWTVELFIVPKGATPPTPTPTMKSKDIRYRKGKIKKSDYECQV